MSTDPSRSASTTESASPPDVRADSAAAEFEALHPRARRVMQIGTMAALVLPTAFPVAILLSAWDGAGLPFAARAALWLGFACALAVLAWRFGGSRYDRTRFALDARGLHIRRGVIWRSETFVPRSRVQHTDVNRGPLDRRLGLSSLKVFTAGTRLASIELHGLPAERALELRDALSNVDDDDL